ncbi:MAG: hypothetical protein RJA53_1955 [Bacteroidota bacterium]|jgi:hypothetical protein
MEALKITDTAIITTTTEKSFENVDCFLLGRIEELTPEVNAKVYKVRTDLVAYQDYEVEISPLVHEVMEELDEQNNVIVPYSPEIPAVMEVRQRLVLIEEKQKWCAQVIPLEQFDAIDSQLEAVMPEGLTTREKLVLKMQLAFLSQRSAEGPWGTGSNWEVFDTENLDILKPE